MLQSMDITHLIKEENMREHLTTFFAVVFVMSMVGATGAIEADQWLLGAVLSVFGISTGALTLYLQGGKYE